jgi:hypothetical protein
MKDFEIVFEYINLEKNNPIGCGRLAPLIKMINDRKEIVQELLDKPENKHQYNLLCFLDYGLQSYLGVRNWSEDYDLKTVTEAIIHVLKSFSDLSEEAKWKYTGEQFKNILGKRC